MTAAAAQEMLPATLSPTRSPAPSRGAITGPRWRLLAETSEILDGSLDYQETLTNVVKSVVPRLADYAVIAVTARNGSASREFSAHRDPEKSELLGQLATYWPNLAAANPWLAQMLQTAETQLVDRVDYANLDAVIADETLRAMTHELALVSMIFVPLVARQRRFGCLVLATTGDSHRRYSDRDVAIANELARRAALAIDHAVLYRSSEQAARAREELMAVVSHDLKNPLATIQMAVQFLLEDLAPNDAPHQPERAQLQVIHRSAQRMYRLVHDLLDAAAVEAHQLPIARESLTVDLLIGDALELLRPLATPKRVSVLADFESTLPPVSADRDRILQVFSNLGGNALKFTPAEGRIELRATRRDTAVEFLVRDTGVGITAEDLPCIFDRFWQATSTTRGSVGLGLAITKGIVEAHGGQIWVESQPGRGTTFRFTLPISQT